MKWSSNLEWIAQLRAAECTVYESHTRPNNQSCFSIRHRNEQSWAENLAWNYSGLMAGIEQWYGEKNDWVNQDTSKVTGHYTRCRQQPCGILPRSLLCPQYWRLVWGCRGIQQQRKLPEPVQSKRQICPDYGSQQKECTKAFLKRAIFH